MGVYGNGIETGRGILLASVDRFFGLGVWGGLWDGWMDGWMRAFRFMPLRWGEIGKFERRSSKKGGIYMISILGIDSWLAGWLADDCNRIEFNGRSKG